MRIASQVLQNLIRPAEGRLRVRARWKDPLDTTMVLPSAGFESPHKTEVTVKSTGDNRWDEKAGLQRDALSSQVIDALEARVDRGDRR